MDGLMTTDEVAQMLRVERHTVYRLVRAEFPLPALLIGGSYRFRREDVTRWIAQTKARTERERPRARRYA